MFAAKGKNLRRTASGPMPGHRLDKRRKPGKQPFPDLRSPESQHAPVHVMELSCQRHATEISASQSMAAFHP
jgi:hypothetical protein